MQNKMLKTTFFYFCIQTLEFFYYSLLFSCLRPSHLNESVYFSRFVRGYRYVVLESVFFLLFEPVGSDMYVFGLQITCHSKIS